MTIMSTLEQPKDLAKHPQNTKRVSILGGGPMSRAVASLFRAGGAEVSLWSINEKESPELEALSAMGITITANFEEAIDGCLIIFFGIPANALAAVAEKFSPYSRGYHIALHGIRGITKGFELPHQIIKSKTNIRKVASFGGPIYFEELTEGRMLAAVLASRFEEVSDLMDELVHDTQIILHRSNDMLGIEIAGAVSNVTAIAIGIADSLGLDETVKGILLTRGLSEATTLGVAIGAQEKTFSGLAGVGDLIPRKVKSIGRHVELGKRLVEGQSIEAILESMHGSVEGIDSVQAIAEKAQSLGIELPLMECINDLLNAKNVKEIAADRIKNILKLDLLIGAEAAAKSRK